MNAISLIILCALIADVLLHLTADLLNLGRLTARLPDAFVGWYDEIRYAAAQNYLRVNTRFEWLASGVMLACFLMLWFGRGFPLLDAWVRGLSTSPVVRGLYSGPQKRDSVLRCAPDQKGGAN